MIVEALSAFSGSFAGSILWHYAHRTVIHRKASEGSIAQYSETKQCGDCRSHVAKYEILPNDRVVCANCIREKQHGHIDLGNISAALKKKFRGDK